IFPPASRTLCARVVWDREGPSKLNNLPFPISRFAVRTILPNGTSDFWAHGEKRHGRRTREFHRARCRNAACCPSTFGRSTKDPRRHAGLAALRLPKPRGSAGTLRSTRESL